MLHRLWAGWRSLVTAWRISVEAWTEGRIPESGWAVWRTMDEEEEAVGSRRTLDQVGSISQSAWPELRLQGNVVVEWRLLENVAAF